MVLERTRDHITDMQLLVLQVFTETKVVAHSYSLNHVRTGDTSIYDNEVVPYSSAGVQAWGDRSSLYVFQARVRHLSHLT